MFSSDWWLVATNGSSWSLVGAVPAAAATKEATHAAHPMGCGGAAIQQRFHVPAELLRQLLTAKLLWEITGATGDVVGFP